MTSMAELERQLLKSMGPAELQKAIRQAISEGARNRYSALKKLAKDVGSTILKEDQVTGLFLKGYETKTGHGLHIMTEQGPIKVKLDPQTPAPDFKLSPLTPINISQVRTYQGSSEDMTWMQTSPETVITKEPKLSKDEIYHWAQRPADIKDRRRMAILAPIRYVNDLADWQDGIKGEARPIVTTHDTKVNLKLVIGSDSEGMGQANVYIPDLDTLIMLLGSTEDIDWLTQMEHDGLHDTAMLELSDMMRDRDLLIIGVADPFRWVAPDDPQAGVAVQKGDMKPPKGKEDWVPIRMATPSIKLWGDSLLMWVDEGFNSTLDQFIDILDPELAKSIMDDLRQRDKPVIPATVQKVLKADKKAYDVAVQYLVELGDVVEIDGKISILQPDEAQAVPDKPPEKPPKAKEAKVGPDTLPDVDMSSGGLYKALRALFPNEGDTFTKASVLEAAKSIGMSLQGAKIEFEALMEQGDIIKQGERGPYALF